MDIPLLDRIELPVLLTDLGLGKYQICDRAIGGDGSILILLAERIPQREQGMFVPSQSHTHYQAVCLLVDWQWGGLLDAAVTDFGILKPNLHFIQRLRDGFLLLGARARFYKDGRFDRNALIADSMGNIHATYCFGDGIQQCLVDSQNRIVTSYFDEGVFGNFGWDRPVGSCGLIVWSPEGERLWENRDHDICDCYAVNLDERDRLWFYYYTAFSLVCTDYERETVYRPGISGSCAFLLDLHRQRILFDAGYDRHGSFLLRRFRGTGMTKGEAAAFVWNNHRMKPSGFSFRGARALLWSSGEALYYTDWTLSDG